MILISNNSELAAKYLLNDVGRSITTLETKNKNYQTALTNFKSDYQSLYGNNIYKDDGIPDIYKKKLDTKVKGTVEDARQNDTKTLLIYENTMYTVATIAAATIVVTAIVLARE